MTLLLITLCAVVAGISSLLSGKSVTLAVVANVVGGAFGGFVSYFFMPTMGFYYPGIWVTLIISGVIGSLIGSLNSRGEPFGLSIPLVTLALLLLVSVFTSCEMGRTDRFHALIGKVDVHKFEEHAPIVDTKHIILTPKETALNLAKNVLGDTNGNNVLGSQLQIDESGMAIQRVAGELWWIIPLDFKGHFQWKDIKVIPGYIRVSAQDPNRPAQLIEEDSLTGKKIQIKYARGSSWEYFMDRKIYYKYPNVNREDYTFEVDDNWRPYYVVSATEPTIGFTGYKNTGAIIFDPQTGEMEFKRSTELPLWVDRFVPASLAFQQLKWWGEYGDGWWNTTTFGAHKNLQKPTHENALWFIQQGEKGYFFTGMTSNNNKDTSLLGVVMYSSRDEGVTYYTMQGADENSALNTATSMLGANAAAWCPVHPLPYNIYGAGTWVIPVIACANGSFQGVAVVNIANTNIRAFDENLEKVLTKYRILLTQNGNQYAPSGEFGIKRIGPAEVLRTGDVIVAGNKIHYLLVKGYEHKTFSATGETNETLPIVFVRPGDFVRIEFLDTDEERVPAEKVEVTGVNFNKSKIQAEHDFQRAISKKSEDEVVGSKNAEREWESLSPEEKRKLLKK